MISKKLNIVKYFRKSLINYFISYIDTQRDKFNSNYEILDYGLFMPDDCMNRPERIHINCPYCWTEFQNFEQIGGRIRYRNKTYDSFETLPIMIEEPRSFIDYIKKFSGTLVRVRVECPGCKKFYCLDLFPYDKTRNKSHDEYVKFSENDQTIVGEYTLLDKLGLLSEKTGRLKILIDHYKKLIPCFTLPLIISIIGLFWFKLRQLETILILLGTIFFFLGILLSLFQWQRKHFMEIKNIGNLPFLIHENYKITYSNNIFQTKIIDRLGYYKKPNLWILAFVEILLTTMVVLILKNEMLNLFKLDNPLLMFGFFLILVIFLISIFIYYLIVAVVGSSMIDFFSRLMFIFKNVPIKLDPWDKKYGLKKVIDIWSSTLVTFIVLSVVFPTVLAYNQAMDFVKLFITSSDRIFVITQLFNNSFFLISVGTNLVVIIIFLYVIYLLKVNIDDRKDEMRTAIKDKIEKITHQGIISNQDLSKISFLKMEYEQVEKIPSIPMPYEIYFTIFYAFINAIAIIYGFFH